MIDSKLELLKRARLIEHIDLYSAQTDIWLIAAGGYGKTSLAKSYAKEKQLPLLCITVPEAGMSIGEFFYTLRHSAIALFGAIAKQLPIISADESIIPQFFAQRFAKSLNQLDIRFALLLDDLHKLGEQSPLHHTLAAFFQSLNKNCVVIVASRSEPAAAWSAYRAKGSMLIIDEHQLGFNQQEAKELLLLHGVKRATVANFDLSKSISNGWAAGLMLLVEHWRRIGKLPTSLSKQKSVEDWFNEEVFSPLHSDYQQLLLILSLPSLIPADCIEEVTDSAFKLIDIENLVNEHAFLLLVNGSDNTQYYKIHDLFRDFLRGRIVEQFNAEKLTMLKANWGKVLWEKGHKNIAVPLLVRANEIAFLANNIPLVALELIETGCGDKLYQWLQHIPEKKRRDMPLLNLWEGVCLLLVNTQAARQLLTLSWQQLKDSNDYLHLSIIWSGIIDSLWLEWANVGLYEEWIEELVIFESVFRDNLPKPLWYKVLRGVLVAVGHAQPNNQDLNRWQREAFISLSDSEMSASERLMLASQLMYLNTWQFGNRSKASRVFSFMARQQDLESATPLARCLWLTFSSLWYLLYDTDTELCLQEAEKGRELIKEYSISSWDNAVPALQCAIAFNDKAVLDDWMAWFMRTENKVNRPFYDTFQSHFLSLQAWLNRDYQTAVNFAEDALIASEKHGSIAITTLVNVVYANFLAENNEFSYAIKAASNSRRKAKGIDSDFINLFLYSNLAKIPLLRNQTDRVLPYLRRAFEAGAKQNMFFPFGLSTLQQSELCALAIEHEIQTEYALSIIHKAKLPPPESRSQRLFWFYPYQVKTFGGFGLQLNSPSAEPQVIELNQKAKEIIAQLVVAGPKGVTSESLACVLWPDVPLEKALNSLYVNIHRIKKLLPDQFELIENKQGQMLLSAHVFVDLWEYRDILRTKCELSEKALEKAFELYDGELLLPSVDSLLLSTFSAQAEKAYEYIALQFINSSKPQTLENRVEKCQSALNFIPYSESLWGKVFQLYAGDNDYFMLENAYNKACSTYRSTLDIDIPKSLQSIYTELMSTQR